MTTLAPKLLNSSTELVSLPRGDYLFSVRAASPGRSEVQGRVMLPSLHVAKCPGAPSEDIAIVGDAVSSGFWLYKPDDAMMVRIVAETGSVLITSVRLNETSALDVDIQCLSRPETPAKPEDQEEVDLAASTRLRVQVTAHVQNHGDLIFLEEPWAGLPGQSHWIEAFEIVPREQLPPHHIEYKALDAAGGETEWVKGGEMCGTRGFGVPLLGFAVRLSPEADVMGHDVVYFGKFLSGKTVGPLMNGAPLYSPLPGDALECLHVAIRPLNDGAGDGKRAKAAGTKRKRDKVGAKFSVLREMAYLKRIRRRSPGAAALRAPESVLGSA